MSAGKPWTPTDERRLRELYPYNSQRATAVILGRSHKAVASRAKILGVKRIRLARPWTAADDAKFRELFPHHSAKDVAKRCNRTVSAVDGHARDLRLHKTPEYIAALAVVTNERLTKSGRRHRFQKGIVPANKGLRRPGYSIGRGRMQETQFKKGQVNHNFMPIGSHRLSKEGYLLRKLFDTGYPPHDWKAVHIILWEEAHGPTPPKHAVAFKDGNRQNVILDNLELITRAELMRRNCIHNLPPQLKDTIFLAGRL